MVLNQPDCVRGSVMSKDAKRLFASVAAVALIAPMSAFAADAAAPAADASQPSTPEILVTARRASEKLEDVPVSIAVISGETLKKLSITRAEDISKLAPGLNISTGAVIATQSITLRGVTWLPGSGTPATPMYINEVPFDPQNTIRAIFDVDQIEVLRGPQGTVRGAPSISGAITISTKKPNLGTFGGYIQGSYGEASHWDIQGAINVPIIKGVLAVRAAVNIENSEGNRVRSVNSQISPLVDGRSYRISALFQPTDTLTIEAMYQRRVETDRQFTQVAGTGSPGAVGGFNPLTGVTTPTIPANFNGPALTVGQRASVSDLPNYVPNDIDLITANAKWKVLGQEVEYIFGRQISLSHPAGTAEDTANMLPGYEPFLVTTNLGTPLFQTQELRLSSNRAPGRFFDYDIGFFQKKSGGTLGVTVPTFFAGAFGNSGAFGGPNGGFFPNPNPAYILNSNTSIYLGQQYDSFYGNLALHLPEQIELSGGLREIRDRVPVNLNTGLSNSLNNVNNAYFGTGAKPYPCAYLPSGGLPVSDSVTYPGTCDIFIPGPLLAPAPESFNPVFHKLIYNISLSHKFSSSVLAYATTGTSYRSGLPAINNPGLPVNLETPLPESATSYEVGIKATISPRLIINADVFQINYKNQLTPFGGVQYYNSISGRAALTSIAFYGNVNSRIRGVELEVNARPSDQLSLGGHLSYTPITSRGSSVPCNIGPAVSASNPINFCASPSGANINQTAPFQASADGSYTLPLSDKFDGYVRFNVNFQGSNPNFGNYPDPVTGSFKPTSAYAVADIFAGLTGKQGVWDAGLYVKNLFNNTMELNRTALLNNIYSPYTAAAAGYSSINAVLPREIGVTLRYAFGSR